MQQKTVHIDKIAETLDESDAVESYQWGGGSLYVWFDELAGSRLLDELEQWGVELAHIHFPDNQVVFDRRE